MISFNLILEIFRIEESFKDWKINLKKVSKWRTNKDWVALMRDKRISSISKKVIPPFIEKLFPSRTAEIQFARWTDTRRIAKDRRLIGVGRFVMDSEGRGRGKGLDSVRLRVTNRIGGKGTGARAMNRGIDLSRLGRSESFFLSLPSLDSSRVQISASI